MTALVAAAVLQVPPAAAQSPKPPPLPPLDLGQTNILDGEGPPGVILEIINLGSFASHLTDAHGSDVAGRNQQWIGSVILHPIIVSEASVAGAHPGVELFLPVTRVANDFVMGGGRHTGLGDFSFAPFLEWNAEPKAGAISTRFAVQVVTPTGDYVPGRSVNTGQGGWQLSPYLALTWRTTARWEMSARAIYDWSGSADSLTTAGLRDRVRPGDVIALDLSTSYAVTDTLRLGIGSYGLRQLGDSYVAGSSLPGSRAQVFAAGPVARYEIGKSALLVAAFGEFEGRNRPQGASLNIRFQTPF